VTAKKLLQYALWITFTIIILSTVAFHVIVFIYNSRIDDLKDESQQYAAQLAAVNELLAEIRKYTNEANVLEKHISDMRKAPAFYAKLVEDIISSSYQNMAITRYEYVLDPKTGQHRLIMYGNTTISPEYPLDFIEKLRELPYFESVIPSANVGADNKGDEVIVSFRVMCVLREVYDE